MIGDEGLFEHCIYRHVPCHNGGPIVPFPGTVFLRIPPRECVCVHDIRILRRFRREVQILAVRLGLFNIWLAVREIRDRVFYRDLFEHRIYRHVPCHNGGPIVPFPGTVFLRIPPFERICVLVVRGFRRIVREVQDIAIHIVAARGLFPVDIDGHTIFYGRPIEDGVQCEGPGHCGCRIIPGACPILFRIPSDECIVVLDIRILLRDPCHPERGPVRSHVFEEQAVFRIVFDEVFPKGLIEDRGEYIVLIDTHFRIVAFPACECICVCLVGFLRGVLWGGYRGSGRYGHGHQDLTLGYEGHHGRAESEPSGVGPPYIPVRVLYGDGYEVRTVLEGVACR